MTNLTQAMYRFELKRTRRRSAREVPPTDYTNGKTGNLELTQIVRLLRNYDAEKFEGGINCCVCGKLYKSKVCLTKHLWEHSIYWNLFDDVKNHDRVLGIQAALILYLSSLTGQSRELLRPLLLVTAPTASSKDRENNNNQTKDSESDESDTSSISLPTTANSLVSLSPDTDSDVFASLLVPDDSSHSSAKRRRLDSTSKQEENCPG